MGDPFQMWSAPIVRGRTNVWKVNPEVVAVVFLRVGAKKTRKPCVYAVKKDVAKTDLSTNERDFE
jgi:hypothetical protein